MSRRWFDALRTRTGLRRVRRSFGACPRSHLELLEVRQVLSSVTAVTLEQHSGGFSGWVAESVVPDSEQSDVAQLVQTFRGQLSAAIVSIESPQISQTDEVSGDQILSSDRGFANVASGAESDLLAVATPESARRQASINVKVVLDWSKREQQVTVVRLAGDHVQVTLQGLGNTSLAASDTAYAEGLIVVNTTEIFANLLPSRALEFSFQQPAAVKDSAVRFHQGSSDPAPLVKNVDHQAAVEKIARTASELQANGSRSVRVALQDASIALDGITDPVGLIDQIFLDGTLTADGASLPSVSNLGLSSGEQRADVAELEKYVPAIRPQNAAGRTSIDADLSLQTQAQATSGLVIPGAVPSFVRRAWNLLKSGKWIIGATVTPRSRASVHQAELADRESHANPSVELPEDLNQVLDWLTWIMNPAEERSDSGTPSSSGVHTETRPAPVPAKQVPVSRDVQTNSWIEQSQARRQRDSFRQHAAWGGCSSVFYDELEMAPLPVSGSFPAELRYECQPRGPPSYSRDVETASAKVDAPESLLERLRYSIAPRGPSLVTVEMQSPDFEFSSGPRVSPEELRYQAA